MEGFSRIDIYDTKGIEYILVIGYLFILIVFWRISGKQIRITERIQKAIGNLSANILKIPQGIFYNKNHTWMHLETTGAAKVGVDDFLQHVTGEVKLGNLKYPGEKIKRGELLTEIYQQGKTLEVVSPISGEIITTNYQLNDNPEVINEDPFEKGWLYKIKPTNWVKETRSCLLAEDATSWSVKELERFKDFLIGRTMKKYAAEPSMVLLQDGGELRDNILSELPGDVWQDFQKEFLDLKHNED